MCPYAVKSLPAGDFKWYHKNSLIDIRIYEYTFNLNFQFQCLNLQNICALISSVDIIRCNYKRLSK